MLCDLQVIWDTCRTLYSCFEKISLALNIGGKLPGGLPTRQMVMLGGGVAAVAVVISVVMASVGIQLPQDSSPASTLPVASGTGTVSTPSPAEPDATTDSPVESDLGSTEPAPVEQSGDDGSDPQIHFTDDNFALLRSEPDRFANSTVAITGRIHEVVDQSTGSQILITYRIHNQAIDSDESRAAVMYQQVRRTGTVLPDIIVDDCISLQGQVRGGIGDTNSLGTPIRIPIVDSNSVTEIECVDSAMPALKTISSNLTQNFAGIELKAERLQFSDGHVRIKILAANADGKDTVYIREKESHAEYQGRLYQNLNHLFMYGSYGLDSILPAESQVGGYLFFEPVEDYTGGPITFRIVIEKVGISESEKSTFILKI